MKSISLEQRLARSLERASAIEPQRGELETLNEVTGILEALLRVKTTFYSPRAVFGMFGSDALFKRDVGHLKFQPREDKGINIYLQHDGYDNMGMFEAPKNELGGVFFKGDVNSTPYVLFRSLISFCAQSIASSKEIEKYRRMANFDGMTGLIRKEYFKGSIFPELCRSASQKGRSLAVLFLDIDNFKKYNDSYGHEQGDRALRTVSSVILSSLGREQDVASRYGGEEIVIALPDTPIEGAGVIGNKIISNVRNCRVEIPKDFSPVGGSYLLNDPSRVTISGGCAVYDNHTSNASGLIKLADEALYQAKEMGRDRLFMHESA